jgi:hypothetical protein
MKTVFLPSGEFTYRDLCTANPEVLPLEVLRFVTRQVADGKIVKHRPTKDARPLYYRIQQPTSPYEMEQPAAAE